jgi:DNA-binding NarL/FixJ family response regulator
MVLLADPARESRELLSDGLRDYGIGRVIVADSVSAVENLMEDGIVGQLALISLGFGDAAGRLIRRLRGEPWQRVIALAPTATLGPILQALHAGASGVLRGHPSAPVPQIPQLVHELSEREIQVLVDVADGRSNKWIGAHLELSALTVKSHLARISRKLGTGDRAHMVAIAMRAGLLT